MIEGVASAAVASTEGGASTVGAAGGGGETGATSATGDAAGVDGIGGGEATAATGSAGATGAVPGGSTAGVLDATGTSTLAVTGVGVASLLGATTGIADSHLGQRTFLPIDVTRARVTFPHTGQVTARLVGAGDAATGGKAAGDA